MADTPRMKALQNLAGNLPVASQRIATGQNAARQIQLQQAVKAAPVGGATIAPAQETGAALATNAGQQAIQNAQNQLQQQGQIGQLGIAEQGRQNQAELASLQAGSRQQAMDETQKFAALNEGLKKQLYDDTMQFQKDELGRTVFNERQLADYARLNAQSDEQFRNYEQSTKLASKRKLQLLEQAYSMIEEDLRQQYAEAEQRKDMDAKRYIMTQQKKAEQEIQRARNNAANQAMAWKAAGGVVTAAIGAI